MSLLVPFLMALLLLGVPLVVLLVAVVASLESLLVALVVALVPSPMPLLVPAGHRGGASIGDTADGVTGVCSPRATADGRTGGSVSPTAPAGPLPAPSPPARLGALWARWKH